uniref:HIG1 domain-containing protein n=1 Tax=Strongyloides papillosus TaxID=174720 RepID=A0A0N5C2Z4_STREA
MFKSYFKNVFCRVAECSTTHHDGEGNHGEKHHGFVKTPGVPAMPLDIGYKSGKDTQGSRGYVASDGILSNPLVPIGMGLTCLALLGMFKNSMAGNKMGTQKFMRYRIYAQFGTVLAMVAGLVYAGSTFSDKKKREE